MKLQRKNRLRALSLGAVAVSGALALTACGSDDTGSSGSGDSTTAANSSIKCDDAKGQLLANGSSAQKNAIDAWVKQFSTACKDVQINYKSEGSGAGVTAFTQGQVAFAGSDSALKPEEVTASKEVCKDGQGIDLPMVGGPIAVGYNVPGVEGLVLDSKTLAGIFDSKITKWNDAAIKKLNPDATLPNLKIQAFHRSDESGTTDNFTKYLIAAAPDQWKYEGGKAWQAKGGQSAAGSSGVAQQVKEVPGAISYMELSYAKDGITAAKLDTGASAPVEATVENATTAIADAKVVGTGADLALELNRATKADGAYPITLVTYEIVCDKGNKAETLAATKAFLTYIASEDGQKVLAENDYAPIPEEIIAKVRTTVASLS
ncbi:phosphate ABC transporter substrate-binding protein PstS [Streptomyces aurantiacus]|uniref:Phosphate-binding protein n=1 Tax=Streptomyces aurantiacus TaxID=47760 RepID=A0A7G1P5I4_9ACTN|nr:phosphate ABC transporter substrate-binding protein PstS [Streptomyces aurantiacus]BCL29080.1 phosphate-binding protein PstS [Streptomyces aurantiacus]